jgi:hypothetical protein
MVFEKETNYLVGLAHYIIVGMFLIVIIALVAKSLTETLIGQGLGWVGAVIGGIATAAIYFFNNKLRNKLKR